MIKKTFNSVVKKANIKFKILKLVKIPSNGPCEAIKMVKKSESDAVLFIQQMIFNANILDQCTIIKNQM